MSEENKVSLVVERHNPTSNKVWIVREQGSDLSTYAMTEACVEVVKDQFRLVICWLPTPLYVLPEFDVGHLIMTRRAVWEMTDYHAISFAPVIVDDDEISEILLLRTLDDPLQREMPSMVDFRVRYTATQLLT